jgi:ribosomal protein S18 acetylase RimI-like enzyme
VVTHEVLIRPLTDDDFEAVHRAFVEAFSDYVIPLAPPPDRLREMLTRRGYVASASVCAIEHDRIVAFTLNGIDGPHGYDSGTGVVPSHRRRGLARTMMERSFDLLRAHGGRDYVLEVIDSNPGAAALYRALGFTETRGLQCWTYDGDAAAGGGVTAEERASVPPDSWEEWWDAQPSWQNASASLARATDERVVIGDRHGCAILFPATGELAQLAVRPDRRRAGIGSRLLRRAREVAGKPLRVLNVDECADGIASFLSSQGAARTVRQLEMLRRL